MKEEKCRNCKYISEKGTLEDEMPCFGKNKNTEDYVCKRYPPTSKSEPEMPIDYMKRLEWQKHHITAVSIWPDINPDQWCGEYKSK